MSGVTQFRREPLPPVQSYQLLTRQPQEEPPTEDDNRQSEPSQDHQTEPVLPSHNVPAKSSQSKPQPGQFSHIGHWTKEMMWCIVSIVLVIVLVLILQQYDNEELPKWRMGLTLNTVIAVIATICRSALVIPVSEGLSQLKWNWFVAQVRPLKDIRTFDQASRGPWSAIALIGKMHGRFISLSSLACVILITSLVTSFLTQSVVSYETRDVTSNNSTVEAFKTKTFKPTDSMTDLDFQTLTGEVSRAAFRAALGTLNDTTTDVAPRCPSARCHWPPFSSLAICASVGGITSNLSRPYNRSMTNVWLPNDYGTFQVDPAKKIVMNITSSDIARNQKPSLYKWENPDVVRAAIVDHFLIYQLPENALYFDGDGLKAAEILWHFCVKTYETEVRDGVLHENVTHTLVNITKQQGDSITMVNEKGEEFVTETTITYNAIPGGLRYMFKGTYDNTAPYGGDYVQQLGENMFTSIPMRNTYGGLKVRDYQEVETVILRNLANSVENIAKAMSANMRASAISETIHGGTVTQKTFVVVRWEWLSFIAAQVCLTIIFLVAVIIYTAQLHIDVVKSSNIAELLAIPKSADGVDGDAGDAGDTGEVIKSGVRSQVGDEFLATLRKDGLRWHLEVSQRERAVQGNNS